jgi:hypothetical protein
MTNGWDGCLVEGKRERETSLCSWYPAFPRPYSRDRVGAFSPHEAEASTVLTRLRHSDAMIHPAARTVAVLSFCVVATGVTSAYTHDVAPDSIEIRKLALKRRRPK